MGGSASVAGSPSLITPVGASRRASTTAFVKCVVPIITACTRETAPAESSTSERIAAAIPAVTSGVVGVLASASTSRPSTRTASVFVPPTSTPMRTR